MKKISRTISTVTYSVTMVNKTTCALTSVSVDVVDIEDYDNCKKYVDKWATENYPECVLVRMDVVNASTRKYSMPLERFMLYSDEATGSASDSTSDGE